jgi:hypothetical protein
LSAAKSGSVSSALNGDPGFHFVQSGLRFAANGTSGITATHTKRPAAAKTGEMWTEIFTRFVTDQVALVVHVYLLAGDVLATIAVGAGIVLEHGPADVRQVANRLVIWGVVAETLCSLALFTFDEGISGAQQSKIIALETRLAPRFISEESRNRIAMKMKQFSGQEYSGMVASDVGDAWDLWREISGALDSAGWHPIPPSGAPVTQFGPPAAIAVAPQAGVMILYAGTRFVDLHSRAEALAAAITAEAVAAGAGPASGATDQHPNAVLIVIGPKPQ